MKYGYYLKSIKYVGLETSNHSKTNHAKRDRVEFSETMCISATNFKESNVRQQFKQNSS